MKCFVSTGGWGVPQDLESCWMCRGWKKVAKHWANLNCGRGKQGHFHIMTSQSVAYAENFRGGESFVTIVWRHKSNLGEVPKARPF